ncbi:MAG: hypothetical protein QOI47_1677 [Actinomycetota bacterium]|nr:hypothetical protein [Actinomycetota bacterium]
MEVPSTDGVTITVHDFGGDGPPLLISHATGFCAGTYLPLAGQLASRRHVWAIDYRGHGDSTAPSNGRFDWDGMGDDLAAVLDALDLRGIDVFGHSMGGGVAMLVESRRPGSFRSAYLFEPIITPVGAVDRVAVESAMSTAARRRRAEFPSKAAALWRYASRTPLGTLRADSLAAYVEHGFADQPDGSARLKCDPEHEAATFEAAGTITFDTVRGLTTPTVVAVGAAEGELGPAAFAADIVAALADATLERHPTLGHFGPLQDPPGIAARILAALAD